MNTQAKGHFVHSLNTLIKRYSLNAADLDKLQNVDEEQIVSLSYTEFGGFDLKTGIYYPEERDLNYKVKLNYLINATGELKTIILLPISNLS